MSQYRFLIADSGEISKARMSSTGDEDIEVTLVIDTLSGNLLKALTEDEVTKLREKGRLV